MTASLGIEPGTHWWKASALTTAQTLLTLLACQNTAQLVKYSVILHAKHLIRFIYPRKRDTSTPYLCNTPLSYSSTPAWRKTKKQHIISDKKYFLAFSFYAEKVDSSDSYWNPKRNVMVTTPFSESTKVQFENKFAYAIMNAFQSPAV